MWYHQADQYTYYDSLRRGRERGREIMTEEIVTENFPNFKKDIDIYKPEKLNELYIGQNKIYSQQDTL